MMQQYLSKQFLFFLLSGGIAAGVNFLSRIVYNLWMSFSLAIVLAYITGMITAFILMRLFVFQKGKNKIHASFGIFIIVNLIALIQVWLISLLLKIYLLPWLGVTSFTTEISHGIAILFPMFSSYLGHKYWTFR